MAKEEQQKREKQHRRRVPIIAGLLAILILFGLAAFVNFKYGTFENKDADSGQVAGIRSYETAALIVVSESSITVTRNGEISTLSEGELDLLAGDIVETDESGLGYIIFSDNSSISLDSKTKIVIEKQKNFEGNFIVEISQIFGRTWSRVENLIGGHTEYSVETPNTIAAVRGTEFGCDTSGNISSCYAIVHDIDIAKKSGEEIDEYSPLSEGKVFTNDNGNSAVGDLALPEDEWTNFNVCLRKSIENILGGDENKSIDFLKLKKEEIGCGDVLGVEVEATPAPLSLPVVKSVADDGVYTTVNTINCKWNGTGATSYLYSIGTAPAKTDIYGWKSTTKSSLSLSGLELSYGKKYYCNVIGKNNDGQSSIKSSDGIYYDNSTGSIISTSPTDGSTSIIYSLSTVSGCGTNTAAPLSDLEIKYYVQSTQDPNKGQYCGGSNGGWSSSVIWHDASISGPARTCKVFSFADDVTFGTGPDYSNAKIYFQLRNKLTGRVLSSKTVTLGAYIIIF